MNVDDVVSASMALLGEPTGVVALVGSGRWQLPEIIRAVNLSVGYIFDVMDEQTEIETINTAATVDVYPLSVSVRTTSRVYVDGFQIPKVAPNTIPLPTADSVGAPTMCAISSTGSSSGFELILYPVPNGVNKIEILHSGFTALVSGGVIPLASAYSGVVEFGVAAELSKKFVVSGNDNARVFTDERNSLLNQIAIPSMNTESSGLWSHG